VAQRRRGLRPEAALGQARADAQDFVGRVERRIAGGGLCVCALDTELLGHWWAEGIAWLGFVVEACRERGVPLVHLDDALEDVEPVPAPPGLPITTWGRERDLSTWSAPRVADLAWSARDAELRAVADAASLRPEAVRELLALQASDWAFVVAEGLATPYGRERAPRTGPPSTRRGRRPAVARAPRDGGRAAAALGRARRLGGALERATPRGG
jgi:1,4-alpha-glucan branching enzyme